jgi:hypothetical protein
LWTSARQAPPSPQFGPALPVNAPSPKLKLKSGLTVLLHFSRLGAQSAFNAVVFVMRTLLAACCGLLLAIGIAHGAERHIFVIPNDADGYGVDRCLASGEHCGRAVANSYCQSQRYAQATSFHKVDRDDITGAVPAAGSGCSGGHCPELVAIVCTK